MNLNQEETQALINKLHDNEMQIILQHRYDKPQARTDDIHWCSRAYEEAASLLGAEKTKPLPEREWDTLQQQIWDASRGLVRFSYEALRNFRLRAEYLKIGGDIVYTWEKSIDQMAALRQDYYRNGLPQTDGEWNVASRNLQEIVETNVREVNNLFALWGNRSSPAWKSMIQLKGRPLTQALERQKDRIRKEFPDEFDENYTYNLRNQDEALAGAQTDIQLVNEKIFRSMRYVGGVLFLFTLGVMIWNITESQNSTLTSIKNILSLGPAIAGGYIGAEAGAELGAVGGPVGVFIGGILGGIICSCVSGVAADSLFDALSAVFASPQPGALTGKLFGPPILYQMTLPDNMGLSTTFTDSLTGNL